jgi:hypothetical protein
VWPKAAARAAQPSSWVSCHRSHPAREDKVRGQIDGSSFQRAIFDQSLAVALKVGVCLHFVSLLKKQGFFIFFSISNGLQVFIKLALSKIKVE